MFIYTFHIYICYNLENIKLYENQMLHYVYVLKGLFLVKKLQMQNVFKSLDIKCTKIILRCFISFYKKKYVF